MEEVEFVPIDNNEEEEFKKETKAFADLLKSNSFVSSAPHTKEEDGELKPIITADDIERERLEEKMSKRMDLPKLTEREKQVLYAIRMFQANQLYSPTCPELAKTFGFSHTRAKTLVTSLVRKGFLAWSPHPLWVHKRILFPKQVQFPWDDEEQFPSDVFGD